MTTFNNFLCSLGFEDLESKTTPELEAMLEKLYEYCESIHGLVEGPFFTETWQPNKDIKRGLSHGWDVHHKGEYDPANSEVCSLSDKETAKMWFAEGYTYYQLPENLVYCNWIEHQAIHAIIDILRMRQFGMYRPGCIELRRAGVLNRFYNDGEAYLTTLAENEAFKSSGYFIKALREVEDEIETYQLIMEAWASAVGVEDWLIFGYSVESFENCFETYFVD
jgi:hypothetical protein